MLYFIFQLKSSFATNIQILSFLSGNVQSTNEGGKLYTTVVVCVRHHKDIVAISFEWPERDDPQHLFLIGQSHASGEGRGTTGSAAGLLPVPQLHWPMTDGQNKDISGRKKCTQTHVNTQCQYWEQKQKTSNNDDDKKKKNLICMSFKKNHRDY